ncbi:MAG: peptidoglycan bridge formation glycyltransferase FemA/FemB family protein [Patescibacteria group bacterium]|nr:peptidoglycan bridge formation glycyltransferase FemA/FemB family protein [Patescibacteria group bacterium]
MNLRLQEITNKNVWEDFLLGCNEKTFLASWNWGEFNKLMGNKIWRLGISENNNLLASSLIIKIQAKRGNFLFLPHGPNINSKFKIQNSKLLEILLEKLKEIAKKEKVDFIRIAPIWERNEKNIKVFKDLGLRIAPIHIHPELTWELDITLPEEDLLMQMRKTTRYLIRRAQKNKEIEIWQSKNLKDLEKFNKLYQEVVNRHHFVPFSLDYLKNEFLAFNSDNQISLFFGRYRGEIISSAIIIFWQNMAFYHHGASRLKYPKIPVSYLLQWRIIQEAKKRNCKVYNFWGIAPVSIIHNQLSIINKNHPWAGLTLFKTGFGGYKKEYVKTQDLILSKKYWLNYLIEKLRKTKRGL